MVCVLVCFTSGPHTQEPTDKDKGYMEDLPRLYYSMQPDSVLGSSVRAMAFADLKGTGGGSFDRKARQQYGAALKSMRVVVNDQELIASDPTLYATLLMDSFEVCST